MDTVWRLVGVFSLLLKGRYCLLLTYACRDEHELTHAACDKIAHEIRTSHIRVPSNPPNTSDDLQQLHAEGTILSFRVFSNARCSSWRVCNSRKVEAAR
jgi:hypothetical protein